MHRTAAIVCGAGVSSTFLARAVRDSMPDRVQLRRLYLAFRTEPFGCPGWWTAAVTAMDRTISRPSVP